MPSSIVTIFYVLFMVYMLFIAEGYLEAYLRSFQKYQNKSPNHENAYANIPCNFRDDDVSRLGDAYLTHAIRDIYIAGSIIVSLDRLPVIRT